MSLLIAVRKTKAYSGKSENLAYFMGGVLPLARLEAPGHVGDDGIVAPLRDDIQPLVGSMACSAVIISIGLPSVYMCYAGILFWLRNSGYLLPARSYIYLSS